MEPDSLGFFWPVKKTSKLAKNSHDGLCPRVGPPSTCPGGCPRGPVPASTWPGEKGLLYKREKKASDCTLGENHFRLRTSQIWRDHHRPLLISPPPPRLSASATSASIAAEASLSSSAAAVGIRGWDGICILTAHKELLLPFLPLTWMLLLLSRRTYLHGKSPVSLHGVHLF